MRRRTFGLAALLLTFCVGASLDFYLRTPRGETADCHRMRAQCRFLFVIDNPLTALRHPVETAQLLWTARWGS